VCLCAFQGLCRLLPQNAACLLGISLESLQCNSASAAFLVLCSLLCEVWRAHRSSSMLRACIAFWFQAACCVSRAKRQLRTCLLS
jgi:hypothetical protein